MEGLSFAINMEIEGEGYYRHQAQKHRGTALGEVFSALAEEESRHAALLRDCEKGAPFAGEEDLSANVFDGVPELHDIKPEPAQLDAYRHALEMEKKSIGLYKRLHSETNVNKELYEYIIAQEEEHYRAMEEVVKALSR